MVVTVALVVVQVCCGSGSVSGCVSGRGKSSSDGESEDGGGNVDSGGVGSSTVGCLSVGSWYITHKNS